ncbi:Holliday junction branch migration DNA helicase RuvB [Patescibacteria group bacterium]
MSKDSKTDTLQNDEKIIQTLRVDNWKDFRGQGKLKKSLRVSLTAARKRGDALEHVMFYGPPGLGKTTLAHIITKEMGASIRITSGPALERAGDLASILTNLEKGDVLFIDEIHRLNKVIEETLYPAMEDFALDVILGKGPGARTVRLDLDDFTLVGATTQIGKISSPLRDRFGVVHRLVFYEEPELTEITLNAAKRLNVKIDKSAAKIIAKRSRKTPRIALKLLKRVRDYSEVYNHGKVDKSVVEKALAMHEVDEEGLDASDRRLLDAIIDKHGGGPVGLSTLAATIAEDPVTIEDMHEPYLLQAGFIKRTSKGRVATRKAYKHLGKDLPKGQGELL